MAKSNYVTMKEMSTSWQAMKMMKKKNGEQRRLRISWWWERRTERCIFLQKIECRDRPEQKARTEAETTRDCRLWRYVIWIGTSDNRTLTKLEEKLNTYLNELPVLGFNSGKYDLKSMKEFLFPHLIEHHPIKLTVKRNNNHVSQDKFSEAPRYFELCCTRLQLWPVP